MHNIVTGDRNATENMAVFFVGQPTGTTYDRLVQSAIPAGFGDVEYALAFQIKLDDSYPTGATHGEGADTRNNWSTTNITVYTSPGGNTYWFEGNFLLDGHNNNSNSAGTFSLQLFNGGRLRWLIGDGDAAAARVGDLHCVQDPDAASLLDGLEHEVVLVRRFDGGTGSVYEMWIDGAEIASETSTARTDMRGYWDDWTGWPVNQQNWMWGVEKQCALGIIGAFEDYKGHLRDIRFYSRAPDSVTELATQSIGATGLVGRYPCNEGEGTTVNDIVGALTMTLVNPDAGVWSSP